MRELYWMSETQYERIKRHLPYSHGVKRVDDIKVLSGIIFVLKRGLQWRDATKEYGPHKTLYTRFVRWSVKGIFNRIFAALVDAEGQPDQLMIDATHLKAHRTSASLLKKGLYPAVLDAPKAA